MKISESCEGDRGDRDRRTCITSGQLPAIKPLLLSSAPDRDRTAQCYFAKEFLMKC
ncbi:hypothetical protein QUA56_13305 [Microcoleus sp. N3A4]|uniref:hypothetical protein n=1 Tax=Microcoleus sp. N3A4 TaxID=3055379 RepID=UPI002FD50E3F